MLSEVLESDIDNNKKLIEHFIRVRLGLTTKLSKHTSGYWLSRGWDASEAYVKSKENKQKNNKSVYSQEFWTSKINPATNTYYTVDEADFERNSRRPIRKEYWIKKGYTEEDSIRLAVETKNKNNKSGAISSKSSVVRRITSKRCVEYYIARGFSIDEAKKLLSNNQKFFSKKICIEKYGEVEGIEIWKRRQDRWQATLNSKSEQEKARINRSKLSKGITVSKAEKLIVERLLTSGIKVETQFSLLQQNKKQYVYDIMYNKKIIEYHGDFWHPNPKYYSEDFINPRTKISAKNKWDLDQQKLQFARDNGYNVLVVWESEFKKNQDETIKKCIQFLTQ
jgi:G:T-mismatch repair DNA endonuclease (very short patch repair protein)